MQYVVEFIGHDGIVRHTLPMSKMGAEMAILAVPIWLESRIVPAAEVIIVKKEVDF